MYTFGLNSQHQPDKTTPPLPQPTARFSYSSQPLVPGLQLCCRSPRLVPGLQLSCRSPPLNSPTSFAGIRHCLPPRTCHLSRAFCPEATTELVAGWRRTLMERHTHPRPLATATSKRVCRLLRHQVLQRVTFGWLAGP